jgi:hypothetical protein
MEAKAAGVGLMLFSSAFMWHFADGLVFAAMRTSYKIDRRSWGTPES